MAWDHKCRGIGMEAAEQLEQELEQQDKRASAALATAIRTISAMYPDKPIHVTTYGHLDEGGGSGTLNFTVGKGRNGSAGGTG